MFHKQILSYYWEHKIGCIGTVIARSPAQRDVEAIFQMSPNHEIASLPSVARNDDK